MTMAPRSSAGPITSSTSSARAAANRAASAQGEIPFPVRRSSRTRSPSGVPPGSRVVTTSRPVSRIASASSSVCVDFPEPSRPSNVMNICDLGYGALRAIVTGGAGFIGSHVAEALVARGDEVHVLDSLATGSREKVPAGAELHLGDIRRDDAALFDSVRPELCVHLAAQADVGTSVERPDYDAEVNVLGTVRVLEAARVHGTHVVFSSTGGAGGGVLAAAGHSGGVYNIGTGVETSINELHAVCRRVTGIDREPEHAGARPGDIGRSVTDPALAARELGWRAEQSLEDGLRLTWESLQEAAAG